MPPPPEPDRDEPADGTAPLGDADRDRYAEALGRHYVDGRLDTDELGRRVDALYRATFADEADALVADLGHRRRAAPAPSSSRRRRRRHGEAEQAQAGWRPTPERFVDPTTGRIMRVWVDPGRRRPALHRRDRLTVRVRGSAEAPARAHVVWPRRRWLSPATLVGLAGDRLARRRAGARVARAATRAPYAARAEIRAGRSPSRASSVHVSPPSGLDSSRPSPSPAYRTPPRMRSAYGKASRSPVVASHAPSQR